MPFLLNPCEILVKEMFFNKNSALQPGNAIKMKFPTNSFQGPSLYFRYTNLKEQLHFAYRVEECTIHCQRLFFPSLTIFGAVLKRSLEENGCFECLDKTEEVINESFSSYQSCMMSSALHPSEIGFRF